MSTVLEICGHVVARLCQQAHRPVHDSDIKLVTGTDALALVCHVRLINRTQLEKFADSVCNE